MRKDIEAFLNRAFGEKAVLLVTCNRIEIYIVAGSDEEYLGLISQLKRYFPAFFSHAYEIKGEENVFRHALRLAAGLESQLPGEAQILAQLKDWLLKYELPFALRELWERAVVLSEKIRLVSGLNDEQNNIAAVVYYDLEQRLPKDRAWKIAVAGTGKMAGLLSRQRRKNIQLSFFSRKNYPKAKELADSSAGKAFSLKDLAFRLCDFDALISASRGPHYILQEAHFKALATEPHRKFYVYDLAMPRNVQPQVSGLKGVVLQDLDKLQGAISEYNQKNESSIRQAGFLVEEALENEFVYKI